MAASGMHARWAAGTRRDRGMMLLGIGLTGVALGSIAIAVNIIIVAVTSFGESPSKLWWAALAVFYLLASVAVGFGGRYLLRRGGAGWDRIEQLRTTTVAGKLIDGTVALFLCLCAASASAASTPDEWPAGIFYAGFAVLLGLLGLARLIGAARLRATPDETET